MTSSTIRQSFLDFFRERGHAIVPSAPVILPSDPTLLFVNAGMNPFKDIFLGARPAKAPRVANTQKCIRVSGKHNDLEEVGRDTWHHTFFEMLGNWSFADYTEREAIAWAWELLTRVWGLPRNRLWATVYREDDEAEALWKRVTDIDPSHILRFGEKENFWEMGETGPCGPCSEIHLDRTPDRSGGPRVNAGAPDVMELWNLVFIRHNRRADGSLEPLPARHIDTGMGLERISAVLQNRVSNYDSDVFGPLLEKIASLSGKACEGEDAVAMRVIADHLRALSIAMADGVAPSNEGRGYVLRRLLRRAARFARQLGFDRPMLGDLFPTLEANLGGVFPELSRERDRILRALRTEEQGFLTTLDRGLSLFEDAARRAAGAPGATFPGEEAFRLYDTYGFPIDLTRMMAAERGLRLDEAAFETRMRRQKDRARQARKEAQAEPSADAVSSLIASSRKCEFLGHERSDLDTDLLAILRDGQAVNEAGAGEDVDLLPAQTPFYAESGGQVSDLGRIRSDRGEAEVLRVRKPAEGILLHRVRILSGSFRVGDRIHSAIDRPRRDQCRRHHTATHLLHAALREMAGTSVKQAGSHVGPDRLRFDFSGLEALTEAQVDRMEERVNQWVLENRPVRTSERSLQEIQGSDIRERNEEKYGDVVRVVEVEGISRECCGGTHMDRTGRVGLFRIVSESSVAAGIRRIEAMAGTEAEAAAREDRRRIRTLAQRFSVAPEDLSSRIDQLLEHNRRLERELRHRVERNAADQAAALAAQARNLSGIPVVLERLTDWAPDDLKTLSDSLSARLPEGVSILASVREGKVDFAASAGSAAVKRGIHCGRLLSEIARMTGGGGGGKPERAQAGGRDPARVADALAAAGRRIETILTSA